MLPNTLVRIFVQERAHVTDPAAKFQATGRGSGGDYLGTEFGPTINDAVQLVKARSMAAGSNCADHVEIVLDPPKRPAKVGPDRYTRH